MLKQNKIYQGDCLDVMPDIDSDSIDCIVTDPPYGLSFMGKDWDKAVPSIVIWQECLRVLKPGAFAFVMCIPRQDCLARMICRLEDAGFNISFSSVLHTFASGFPKAASLSKQADKRAGIKREVIGIDEVAAAKGNKTKFNQCTAITPGKIGVNTQEFSAHKGEITEAVTEQAKALEGGYSGMQLKPAVEIVIVAMKPIEEKTYLDQAISNGHGCTWLDDCRIPYETQKDATFSDRPNVYGKEYTDNYFFGANCKSLIKHNNKGRFPANVLCEDNVLDDGIERKTGDVNPHSQKPSLFCACNKHTGNHTGDNGSFSRYFNLDSWAALHFPSFDDIPNVYNIDCTSYEPIISFFHHIQNKQDHSDLSLYLYKRFFYQVSPDSFDTLFSHNNVNTCLSRDVPEFHHRLCKLLIPFSSDNSLHNSLLANEALYALNLKALGGFLDYYRVDHHLCDECDHLFLNLSLLIPLLLSYVLEHTLSNLREGYQGEIPEDIYRQMCAYAFLFSSYHISPYLSYIAGEYKKDWFAERIKLLPKEAQKTFPFMIIPKASKSEKNRGLNKSLLTCECFIIYKEKWKEKDITREEKLAVLQVDMDTLHLKGIEEYGTQINIDSEWSTLLFGKNIMKMFQEGIASIIKMGIPSITISQILNWLTSSLTREYIQDVKQLTGDGGSHVENAENYNTLLITINAKLASLLIAKSAVSNLRFKIRMTQKKESNVHCSVKPIKLMSWLITLASREGNIVLDPFCGSGTTVIAAKMLGRQYIGIEREEEYCEIARKRVAVIPSSLSSF